MKFLIMFVLALPVSSQASVDCVTDEETGLSNCVQQIDTKDLVACPAGEEGKDNQHYDEQSPPIPFCSEDQLYGGTNKMTPAQIAKKEKEMQKLCKRKARNYKRSKAKKMLKDWNFFQAIQIGLKSKKKIMRNSHKNETKKYNFSQYINPEEVKNMNKKQFSSYVMAKIKKEVPNIDDMVKHSKKKPSAHGYKKEQTFLMNMVLSSEGGESCVMKPKEFPKEQPFTPKDCMDCDEKQHQNNFTNDCSYMVTDKISEEKAREWTGASKNKTTLNPSTGAEDSHCNHEMKGIKNDTSKLDKAVADLCSYAKDGYKPQMKIETSRNMFNDYTDNLAQKRGNFTKSYLYHEAKSKCKTADGKTPAWLEDEDSFKGVVEVIHPAYAPNLDPDKADGNYGPSPYATGAQRETEYKNLIATLEHEKKEKLTQYNDDLVKAKAELEDINIKLNNVSDDVSELGLKQQYELIANELESDNSDTRDIQHKYNDQGKIVSAAKQYMERKKIVLQEISDLETKKKNIDLKKYKMVGGEYELVRKLKEYYTAIDNTPPAVKNTRDFKDKWNKDLFNDFKMARVHSDFVKENEWGIDEEMITPELQAMLNAMIEIDTYTCVLEPVKTLKFDAYLKAPLKVATGIMTPVSVVAGGVGMGVATVGHWIFDAFCIGCDRPGNVIPRFKDVFGKKRRRLLPKYARRKKIKEAWKAYVSWGGKLDFDNWKLINEHKIGNGKLTKEEQAINEFEENVSKSACFNEVRTQDKDATEESSNESNNSSTVIKE